MSIVSFDAACLAPPPPPTAVRNDGRRPASLTHYYLLFTRMKKVQANNPVHRDRGIGLRHGAGK